MSVSSFGRNIRAIREHRQITQEQLADSLGMTKNAISNWETQGTKPRQQEMIDRLKELFGVNDEDLFGFGDGFYAKQAGLSGSILRAKTTEDSYAPLWCRAACGDAREVFEQTDEEYWVPPHILKRWNHEGGVIQAGGDSMDLNFPDGAHLYVIPNDKEPVQSGNIALVKVNGDDATIKRYSLIDGLVVLTPESTNPEHKRRVIDSSDPDAPEVRLLAKVVNVLDYELS